MGAVGVAWTIVTYFVVPVLIYEKVGPWKAVKRSASILRKTWGEALVGNLGLGVIFFLFALVGILIIVLSRVLHVLVALALVLGALSGSLTVILVAVAIAVVFWIVLAIVYSAAQSVLVAALYRYATTGQVSEEFQGVSFATPFAR